MPISTAGPTPSVPPLGADGGEGRYELIQLLMDSLLHDARNPLNALSINIEVLAERLRHESGGVLDSSHEKSLRSMREQIGRVDATLQRFVSYVAVRPEAPAKIDLAAVVKGAIELLGHQARRCRVEVSAALEPAVLAFVADPAALRWKVLGPIAQAIARAGTGGRVKVSASVERGQGVLRVGGGGPKVTHELFLPLE